MLPAEGHAKPSGRMRKIVLFSILVVLSVSAGFSTGWPQRKAMILAARYILDVEVDLIGITSIGAVHIDEVRVYDTKSDRRANWPAFVARGVEVNYTLFPQDGRYLNEIDIDSVHATLDATDPSDTNYDFIDAVLARETDAGETDLRFFPESVNLRYIHGEFMSEDGYVVVDGLGLASDFFGPETLNAHFSSEACSGSWRSTESGEVVHVSEGYVDIRAAIGRERIEAEILVAMPGLLEAEGNAGVDVDGESFGAASLQFSTLRVHGEALSVIGHSLLPLPIAFGLLDVSGLSVVADLSADRVFPEAEFTGRVAALEVGEPGHTLFSGNVSIEGTAASGDTHTATARATFAGGHAIEAVLSATGAQAGLRASFEGWSKEAVEETAPADLRPTLEALDYETLGGVFAVAWDDPTYIVSGNLQTSGSGAGEAIHLTAFGEGSLEAGPLFSGDVSARLGASSVTAKA
ncbi:MAG: hypothetical protein QGG73_10750, partial [Candidatus Hydrogenedentes bacterium]|nr:hypothetical protein [Candidatus Hydrogenedentota bacterium]